MTWELSPNWASMSNTEKDAWSIQHHLSDRFPVFVFTVTPEPNFCVRIENDSVADVDVAEIQAAVDEFYSMVYGEGAGVEWGTPVHVEHGT